MTLKGVDGETHTAGIVYMYADNAEFEVKDRIHHDKKETESQHSWVQRLIINDGSEETENPDLPWNVNDFTFEGQTVTGLSESGIAKRATNKDLVIPDFTREGMYVTAIADAKAGGNGLFASATGGLRFRIPSGRTAENWSICIPGKWVKGSNIPVKTCIDWNRSIPDQ